MSGNNNNNNNNASPPQELGFFKEMFPDMSDLITVSFINGVRQECKSNYDDMTNVLLNYANNEEISAAERERRKKAEEERKKQEAIAKREEERRRMELELQLEAERKKKQAEELVFKRREEERQRKEQQEKQLIEQRLLEEKKKLEEEQKRRQEEENKKAEEVRQREHALFEMEQEIKRKEEELLKREQELRQKAEERIQKNKETEEAKKSQQQQQSTEEVNKQSTTSTTNNSSSTNSSTTSTTTSSSTSTTAPVAPTTTTSSTPSSTSTSTNSTSSSTIQQKAPEEETKLRQSEIAKISEEKKTLDAKIMEENEKKLAVLKTKLEVEQSKLLTGGLANNQTTETPKPPRVVIYTNEVNNNSSITEEIASIKAFLKEKGFAPEETKEMLLKYDFELTEWLKDQFGGELKLPAVLIENHPIGNLEDLKKKEADGSLKAIIAGEKPPQLQLGIFDRAINGAQYVVSGVSSLLFLPVTLPYSFVSYLFGYGKQPEQQKDPNDVDIDVIHTNWWWRHLFRTFRFTNTHLMRIRPGYSDVRAAHPYETVAKIVIQDATHIVINYTDGSSPDWIQTTEEDCKRIINLILKRCKSTPPPTVEHEKTTN